MRDRRVKDNSKIRKFVIIKKRTMKLVYNQLKLSNRKGRLFEYVSLEKFYAMVLNTWRGEYPDGKIDYMRFLMDWTRLSGAEIYRITEDMMNQVDMGVSVMDCTIVVVDWNNYNESLRKLNYLMSALCYCVNHEECYKAKDFMKAFNRIYARFHETDSH